MTPLLTVSRGLLPHPTHLQPQHHVSQEVVLAFVLPGLLKDPASGGVREGDGSGGGLPPPAPTEDRACSPATRGRVCRGGGAEGAPSPSLGAPHHSPAQPVQICELPKFLPHRLHGVQVPGEADVELETEGVSWEPPSPQQGTLLTTCPDENSSFLCPQTPCGETGAWAEGLGG